MFRTPVGGSSRRTIENVLQLGLLSEGFLVRQFEAELAKALGLSNVVATNSGTSALHLALAVAGVGPGDEVIVPAQTFIATGMAVLMTGAKVVFADVNPRTGNVDVASVRAKVNHRTRAIIPVAWAGLPSDLEEIVVLAGRAGVVVVEDNAQALGATYQGEPLGSFSRYAAFSFQSTKHVTTGDGGALFCSRVDDYIEARRRRWFGIDRNAPVGELGVREFDVEKVSFKYHMNELAAAVGLGSLVNSPERLKARQRNGASFVRAFDGLPGMTLTELPADRTHAYYVFQVLVEGRAEFVRMMAARGIPSTVVSRRIDKLSVFGPSQGDFPGTDEFDAKQIALPCHDGLTDEDVGKVIEAVRRGW